MLLCWNEVRRAAVIVLVAGMGVLGAAGVAAAHVEVEAEPARALAQNAVLSFSAEAESDTAGITQVEIVTPAGVATADVSATSTPAGWAFTRTGRGFTVAGKALAAKTDAEFVVRVRQLPRAKRLIFKALVNYSDGQIDRWIELPQAGQAEPEHPAAVLELAPAAAGSSPSTTATGSDAASDTVTPSSEPSSERAQAPAENSDDGTPVMPYLLAGLVAVAVLAAAAYLLARRSRTA